MKGNFKSYKGSFEFNDRLVLLVYTLNGFTLNRSPLIRIAPLHRQIGKIREAWFRDEVFDVVPDHVHKVNLYLSMEPTYMERAVAQNADMMFVVHPAHLVNQDHIDSLHKAMTGHPRYFRVDRDVLVKQLDGTKFTTVSDDLSDTNLCWFFEKEVQDIDKNFESIKKWVSTKLYVNEPLNILLCKPTHAIRLFANNGKVRR